MAEEQKAADEQVENQAEGQTPEAVVAPKEEKRRWHKGRYRNSKRHVQNKAKVEKEMDYEAQAGIDLLKSLSATKFDETVAICIRLGIDPKKTDQLIRGAVSLPHGIGKSVRVICFAEGEKADAAKAAGAIEVGSVELAKKIEGGWTEFDVAIAAPDMMKHVGRLGRVLGPQGKMPSPKAGTVTPDVATAVAEFAAGKVEFRTDAGANIHAPVGKRSFSTQQLTENVNAFVDHIRHLKPSQAKGAFVTRVTVASTMSPGVRLDLADGGHHA